jgi:transcriptional regulator with XRE-family HTH domain
MSAFSVWGRIDAAMTARGITKAQLARIADVSPGSVQKWAAGGNITLEPALRIGTALGIPPGELMPRATPRNPDAEVFLAEAQDHMRKKMVSEGALREPHLRDSNGTPPGYGRAPAAPPQNLCRFPADCDLTERLTSMESALVTMSAQVQTLTQLLGATLAASAQHVAPSVAGGEQHKRKAG